MFNPDDVVTVWIALDDMEEELGPLVVNNTATGGGIKG
jgi:ectoine hydroxylase-related dioxygenase (phytanoyl-CoA dioxygenase family)